MNSYIKLIFQFTLTLILIFYSSWLHAQKITVHEIHIDSLLPTLETFGADSLTKLLYNIPIWELDESIALDIVQEIDLTGKQASINSHFLFNFSKYVQNDIIFEKLNSMLEKEILDMKQQIESNQLISRFSKDLLISYQYQDSELIHESLILKLNKLYELLDISKTKHKNEKRSFLRFLIHGISTNQENINYLTSNIHALLQILNYYRPDEFPSDKIRDTEKSISSRYKWVFQNNISPIYIVNQPSSFQAKITPRSEHYLFNKEGIIYHPAKRNSNIELLIFYSNTAKTIIREINVMDTSMGNSFSPVSFKIYIVYILEEEIIEMQYGQELYF